MEYKNLGRSGLQVSAVGLGCNNFGMRCDETQTAAVVDKAIELGITFFDTADIYGGRGRSEEFLGKALQGRFGVAGRVATSSTPSRRAFGASAPTTSTSTRFTSRTFERLSRRRCAR